MRHSNFVTPALRIALLYVLFAGLWIIFSDQAVALLFGDVAYMHRVQTLKGWFFVGITGLLLYGLMRHTLRKLEVVALEDTLTGLPNRLAFTGELDHWCWVGLARGQRFSLTIVDVDNFADLNDEQGHSRGDELLGRLSQMLREKLGPQWYIARLGGDEFALVSPPEVPAVAVERMVRGFLQFVPRMPGQSSPFSHTLCAGTCWFPEQGTNARDLLSHADMALLYAKSHGRGQHKTYHEALKLSLVKRMSLLKDLRQACEQGEFSLVYQPQWSPGLQAWTGAEVLVRWYHERRGRVPPDEFIPLAEKEGLIGAITEFVVSRVREELSAAGLTRERLPWISINLSHPVLLDHTVMTRLVETLSPLSEQGPRVMWEITETATMENLEATLEAMTTWCAEGVEFSIDDFGTGYSSLARLKQMPLKELKIDRSFIRDIPEDNNDAVITQAILAMAQTLSLQVVAEGVETEAQADFLRRYGCPVLQGYLYARPMPVAELATLLKSGQ